MTSAHVILGLDTSNYTTSLAMLDVQGKFISEERKLLEVKKGALGLRQSEALFQHIRDLPMLSKRINKINSNYNIVAIAAATRPRPISNSYMPVFLAAQSFGETMSNLLNIPFYSFSHQEGHIEAGLWSLNLKMNKPFLTLHISGGTTELLKVIPIKNGYNIEIVGKTGDISAGQFIDRVGVKLNLPFPAGKDLEKLCEGELKNNIDLPIAVKDTKVSFSGPETFIYKKLYGNVTNSEIAYSVFYCIGKSLYKLIRNALKDHHYEDILIVGGVASNKIIKAYLQNHLRDDGIKVYFGESNYCSDNAVGIAALGMKSYQYDQGDMV